MGLRASVCAAVIIAAACGQKSSPGPLAYSSEHATRSGSAGERTVPAMSAEQAAAALARALERGDDRAAVIYANRLTAAGGNPSDQQRDKLLEAIDALRADQLPGVWTELDESWPAALIAFRRALVARHTGEPAEALAWVDRAGGDAVIAQRVKMLRAELEAQLAVTPARIAVVLPLSGPYGRIGAELRAAIELAHASHGAGAELRFLDSGGEAEGAAEAVSRAVFEHHAVAVLGPVGMHESAAAAARAAELGIPIALLSPQHHGAAPDVGVFRLWSSPAWEARQAVEVALANGYDRLAILAPRDEQGAAQIRAFTDAARRAGATVVASGQYDPTATDLEPDIKAFLGLDPRSNRRLARHLRRYGRKKGWKTFSPQVGFDLLFLPDDYRRAALVAAFFPYFNVELRSEDVIDIVYLKRKHGGRVPQVVQLLGSSGWHHPGLIPRGGQLLEGALFLDVYAGGDDEAYATESGATFATAFQQRYRRPATPVAAQAHDAALLVFAARARAARADQPRDAMVEALLGARLRDGACGPAVVGRDGEIDRDAVVLRIDGGQFVVHER